MTVVSSSPTDVVHIVVGKNGGKLETVSRTDICPKTVVKNLRSDSSRDGDNVEQDVIRRNVVKEYVATRRNVTSERMFVESDSKVLVFSDVAIPIDVQHHIVRIVDNSDLRRHQQVKTLFYSSHSK